jgi:hypothetical protein
MRVCKKLRIPISLSNKQNLYFHVLTELTQILELKASDRYILHQKAVRRLRTAQVHVIINVLLLNHINRQQDTNLTCGWHIAIS